MRSAYRDVVHGCPVFTSDGFKLGVVKEQSSTYFKVDARLQPDYWLSYERIVMCDDERVIVDFEKRALSDYRLREPGLPPEELAAAGIPHRVIGSMEEQRVQREKMERELEEQRKNLPGGMPGSTGRHEPRRDEGTTSEKERPFPDQRF